jgi:Tfp pilus assembly protein PilN
MNWRAHATPDELARIEELKETRQDASAEMKQIYERCRKRMQRTPTTPPLKGE